MVLISVQDIGNINGLLLPHTIFKEEKWYFGDAFYVCFQNSDIIIGHVITEVSVAIRVNELHIFSKFGHVLSRKKVTETCFCFLVVP